jgi:hypothetical protein
MAGEDVRYEGASRAEDVVLCTKVSEFRCYITLIVIKDKEPFTTNCLQSSVLLKMLYKLKANLICSLAIRAN